MVDKNFINKHLKALKDCVKNASYEIMEIYQSERFEEKRAETTIDNLKNKFMDTGI